MGLADAPQPQQPSVDPGAPARGRGLGTIRGHNRARGYTGLSRRTGSSYGNPCGGWQGSSGLRGGRGLIHFGPPPDPKLFTSSTLHA